MDRWLRNVSFVHLYHLLTVKTNNYRLYQSKYTRKIEIEIELSMTVNTVKGKTICNNYCFVFPCASSSSRRVSTLLALDSSHSHPLHAVISLWNHNRSWMKHPRLRCWAATSSSFLLFSCGMFHNGGFCRALWILFHVFPNPPPPQTIRECATCLHCLWRRQKCLWGGSTGGSTH